MAEVLATLQSLPARVTNTLGAGIRRRICFLHFEKCAGTSLDDAIRRRYVTANPAADAGLVKIGAVASLRAAESLRDPVWALRLRVLAYTLSLPRTRYVHGHVQVDEALIAAFADRFAFVTVLRDPVKRWISHYLYNRFKSGEHQRITEEMASYIDTPRGRALGRDYVDLLIGNGDAGEREGNDLIGEAEMARAERVLRHFALVGRVEDMDAFVRGFRSRFGARLDIERRNAAPAQAADYRVDPALMARIEEICAPNRRLYALAAEPA